MCLDKVLLADIGMAHFIGKRQIDKKQGLQGLLGTYVLSQGFPAATPQDGYVDTQMCCQSGYQDLTYVNAQGATSVQTGLQVEGCVLLTCPHRILKVRSLAQRIYQDYTLRAARPTHLHVLDRKSVV